jgi:hypothetical protein
MPGTRSISLAVAATPGEVQRPMSPAPTSTAGGPLGVPVPGPGVEPGEVGVDPEQRDTAMVVVAMAATPTQNT